MKKNIEFVSKAIGLVTVCSGIVSAIGLVCLIIFLGSDYSQLQQFISGNLIGSRELNNALYAISQIERQFCVKLLIISLLPIPFGMYLMKSNNFLIRFCCPDEKDHRNGELSVPHFAESAYEKDIVIGDFNDADDMDYGKCPACNADLIKRKLEYGSHAGKYILSCSNYPRCKQIQPYKARHTAEEQPFRL